MKILKYDNPERDIIQITREEFRSKYTDFIVHNMFTEHLRKEGKPEKMVVLDQIKNVYYSVNFQICYLKRRMNEKS